MNDSEAGSPAKSRSRFFYGYTIVIAATWMMTLIYGMRSAYGLFLKPVTDDFGWSRAAVSGAFSISMIVQGIMAPLMGGLTDRLGPRVILVVATVLSGAGYLLLLLTDSMWQLYLFYGVIVGVSMSGYLVPLLSTLARWFSRRRNLVSGISLGGISLGSLLAPPGVNWLIAEHGWRIAFAVLGIICLVFIAFVSYFIRRQPSDVGQVPYGETQDKASGQKANASGLSLRIAAGTSMMWITFLIFVCFGYCMISIMVHLVPYAVDMSISPAVAANILAVTGGVAIAGNVLLGIAADKIGIKYVLIFGFALLAATSFWLASVREVSTFYLYAVIFGFATGIVTVESPVVAWLFGLRSHGLILGVMSFGFTVGAALGPFLTGYIFDTAGSYNIAFLICGIVGAAGIALSALLSPVKVNLTEARNKAVS